MIAFYYETRDMRTRIEGLLAGAELQVTECRKTFHELFGVASVAIAGLGEFSDTDVTWLRAVLDQSIGGPSCVLVTPLSLESLQRVRQIESNRCHVVWAEEAADRLVDLVGRIEPWYRDPLRLLGHRLLRDHSFHWSLVKAIKRMCGTDIDPDSEPPPSSVGGLAQHAKVPPDAFRRYWRTEVPLQCGPKEFLSWATLLWAVRQRPYAKWDTIAQRAGVRRRTLERYSVRLTNCTLAAAGRDPGMVQRRFEEWVAQVSAVDRSDTPAPVSNPIIQRRIGSPIQQQRRLGAVQNQDSRGTVDLASWLAARERQRQVQARRQGGVLRIAGRLGA